MENTGVVQLKNIVFTNILTGLYIIDDFLKHTNSTIFIYLYIYFFFIK